MVRVLIVDDEPTILSTVAAMLRMENYAVSTACDGQEGLDRARICQPDLIITDFNMPKLNGLELLSAVRREPAMAAVPVLMLSGNKVDAKSAHQGSPEAYDFLAKPFTRAQLLCMMQSLLTPRRP